MKRSSLDLDAKPGERALGTASCGGQLRIVAPAAVGGQKRAIATACGREPILSSHVVFW